MQRPHDRAALSRPRRLLHAGVVERHPESCQGNRRARADTRYDQSIRIPHGHAARALHADRIAKKIGFLDPEVSLSHCIFISGHSWLAYPYGDDLKIIADSGASVAYSPLKYLKLGIVMESFDKYRQAGINMGIGTDTFPKDILSDMRYAAIASRVADKSFLAGHPRDVFNAITLGGAKMLGRDDLGRLQKGAKADIAIVNLRDIAFGAVRDPIRSLMETAVSRDVRTVIVDGETLVDNGKYLRLNEEELLDRVQAKGEQVWDSVPKWHWTGKSIDEVVPLSFKIR